MPRRQVDHKLQMHGIKFNHRVCTVDLFLFCCTLMDEVNISVVDLMDLHVDFE